MLNRRINYTSEHFQLSLDTIDIHDFYILSEFGTNKIHIPKELLNLIFEYGQDEKILKIREITKKIVEKIGNNYNIEGYYIPLVKTTGRVIEITENIAKRKCGERNDITCIINMNLDRILGVGNGHGLVLGTPFLMHYQSYMGAYQLLGHLLNTSDIKYNNNWIRRLITISGYKDVDEFIYYSRHCNLWKTNEQNLWILTDNPMITYERYRNNQETLSYNYRENLNNIAEQIYLAADYQITREDLEMNRLRTNFNEELTAWGSFARQILRQNIPTEEPEHIFTTPSLRYMRRLRRRYPGLSIREIIDREIANTERHREHFRRLYGMDIHTYRRYLTERIIQRGERGEETRLRRRLSFRRLMDEIYRR